MRWQALPSGRVAHALNGAAERALCGAAPYGGVSWAAASSAPRCRRCERVIELDRSESPAIPEDQARSPGLMETDLARAIAAGKLDDRHAAAVALAQRYALLIDSAVTAARYRESMLAVGAALATLDAQGAVVGVDYRKHWDKITDALAAHSVASDLGPKLLAALTALGLTITAAAVPAGKAGGKIDDSGGPTPSRLDEIRARRIQREGANGA
jgi:hypothetical protein